MSGVLASREGLASPGPAGASRPAPTREGSCGQTPSSSTCRAVCSESLLRVSTGFPCLQIQGKQATAFPPGLQGIPELVQRSQLSNLQPRPGAVQDAPHSPSFDALSHPIGVPPELIFSRSRDTEAALRPRHHHQQ